MSSSFFLLMKRRHALKEWVKPKPAFRFDGKRLRPARKMSMHRTVAARRWRTQLRLNVLLHPPEPLAVIYV